MRPRGLLDMLIVRFNGLGDAIDDDKDTEANDTRLRICSCLYLWLKNYPNDIINRRTRQRVVTFLKERVALFPALYDMYIQLLPLSSTQYFNAWRWPTLHHYHHQLQLYNLQLYHPQHVHDHYQRPHPEQSSGGFSDQMSISSSHISPSVSSVSDDESDAGFPDSVSVYSEEDMDEDQEWGMVDDDEVPSAEAIVQSMTINDNPSRVDSRTDGDASVSNNGTTTADGIAKTSSMNMDGLAAFAYLARGISGPPSSNVSLDSTVLSGVGNNNIAGVIAVGRDRRSSTGSFAPIPSACAMETFVAGRRGSTSSVSSNPGPFTIVPQQHYYHHHLLGHHSAVATGSQEIGSDHRHSRHGLGLTHPFVQPSGPAPSIGKRSSSQAYRQQRRPSAPAMPTQQELSTTTPTTPLSASTSPTPMMQPGLTSILGVAEAGSETGAHMSSQLTLALNASSTTLTAPIPHGTALSTPFPLAPPLETSKSETSKSMGAFSKAAASIFSKESSNGSNNNNNDGEGNVDNKIDPFNHHQQQLSMKAAAAVAAGAGATSLTGPNAWLSSFYPGHMNPLSMTPVHIPLMEIKNLAIAEQLTCVEYGLFRKLKPRDMLRQVWKTKKGSTTFQACIAHFNFISSWVGTMILLPTKAKHRAKMMEKFISIAKILRDMGNFNTTMAIIAAMNTSSIHRLSQTRELIQGKDIWNTFKELEQLMSSERSFFEYRAALRASKLPCIPYMGVHLADLFSISEGNRDFRGPLQHQSLGGQGRVRGQDAAQLATTVGDAGGNGGQTLHWQKFVLMTDVISMVIAFQQEPCYRIKPDGFISRLITETYVWDDEELYTRSVGLEPGKPNHTRTLSKFAFFG
ncbi:hypothetical protein BGZ99_009216 [Dissophora globulifera]|uniref:Ras guanine nucleotide exchange factor domain-containing protein n=1 Tax=Dissophora globulifera TaxID=979702 RepID=A0A9P6R543_9FUNG|nr:hypothetical protein BGZ99_009216 [Dissophora globulifera]